MGIPARRSFDHYRAWTLTASVIRAPNKKTNASHAVGPMLEKDKEVRPWQNRFWTTDCGR